jgi:uncharacterized protein YraI
MSKSVLPALVAALFLGQAANAAISTADLNVRSGPGVQYPVIGVIAANTSATVADCMPGSTWCMVDSGGLHGWADSAYLAQNGARVGSTVTYGSTAPLVLTPGPSGSPASSGSGQRYNVFPSEDSANYGTDSGDF